MKLLISRYVFTDKQTIGNGFVLDSEYNTIKYEFRTLELPYKNNKINVSCIPVGEYKVKKRYSEKFGNHFHIQNVKDRSYILIHKGNYFKDTLGCILVGNDLNWLDNDDYVDVVNSDKTMKKLRSMLPKEFDLSIVSR